MLIRTHRVTTVLRGWVLALLCTLLSIAMASGNNNQQIIVAPGASAERQQALLQAYQARDAQYKPRTEHFLSSGEPQYINRLMQEDSPYLLQHAHNPVNWYPWGEEAFAAAREQDKPIFLSIGYATCHWCHVMERESFESTVIADILNTRFIAIKVDREQRPDVDSTYMTAVQMLTGRGGWPLSAFMNPLGQPFYGGTYFPPEAFGDLLQRVATVWVDNREALDEEAQKVANALASVNTLEEKVRDVGDTDIHAAIQAMLETHDDLQGGFGSAPKFPRESSLEFMLEQARRLDHKDLLEAVNFTLQRMAAGGIHDQVGGGFHRYTVDNDWLIPHFEKMLYNQAALSRAYLDGWLLTGDWEHRRVVQRTLDYVLREMTSEDGLFYSATDADSDGGEGLFFIWTPEELDALLDETDATLAKAVWDVTAEGNFEERSILHLDGPIAEVAAVFDIDPQELAARLDEIAEKLWVAREKRIKPLLDDKVITAWNAMLITALAEAGDVLGRSDYLQAAGIAADRLLADALRNNGELWRTRFEGRWSVQATQPDYAYLAEALLTLYDATEKAIYLRQAQLLVDTMDRLFLDHAGGGYFMGAGTVAGAEMPVRPKDLYDNAIASGNSVAGRVLVRLWHRTGNEKYRDQALALFGHFSDSIARGPLNFPYLLTAVSELQFGESGHRYYGARGKLRATGKTDNDHVVIDVTLAEGWHINAHEPLQDYLIGTAMLSSEGVELENVIYPAPERTELGFQREALALYHDEVSIKVPLSAFDKTRNDPMIRVSMNLQACNDEVCLAPETASFTLARH